MTDGTNQLICIQCDRSFHAVCAKKANGLVDVSNPIWCGNCGGNLASQVNTDMLFKSIINYNHLQKRLRTPEKVVSSDFILIDD